MREREGKNASLLVLVVICPEARCCRVLFILTKSNDRNLNFQSEKSKDSGEKKERKSLAERARLKQLFSQFGYTPSSSDRVGSMSKQKLENVWGCDWLMEISVTVRRCKKTSVHRDRCFSPWVLSEAGEVAQFWVLLVVHEIENKFWLYCRPTHPVCEGRDVSNDGDDLSLAGCSGCR